jgi:hypothetical protein
MPATLTANFDHDKYNNLDALLTETQLAERWQLSPKTLQNARVAGTGVAFVKIGHAVRYRLSDVLAYEQSHVRGSTSEAGLP